MHCTGATKDFLVRRAVAEWVPHALTVGDVIYVSCKLIFDIEHGFTWLPNGDITILIHEILTIREESQSESQPFLKTILVKSDLNLFFSPKKSPQKILPSFIGIIS